MAIIIIFLINEENEYRNGIYNSEFEFNLVLAFLLFIILFIFLSEEEYKFNGLIILFLFFSAEFDTKPEVNIENKFINEEEFIEKMETITIKAKNETINIPKK